MGAFMENVKLIIDDLKSSWYFRLWSFFWLFCAITVFAALIILGGRTTRDTEHRDIHLWIENETSITLPDFHIRINRANDPTGQVITGKACYHRGQPVSLKQCMWNGNPVEDNKCFEVMASSVTVSNVWGEIWNGDGEVVCFVNTTGVEPDGNNLIVWEDDLFTPFGDVDSHSVWITPTKRALVVLDKEMIYTHDLGEVTTWHKRLDYRTSVSIPGQYIIATILGTFRVPHFFEQNSYNAWMGVSDVGGFAFFTIILHTIVMMILGVCLDNDSRFLKGDGGHRPI